MRSNRNGFIREMKLVAGLVGAGLVLSGVAGWGQAKAVPPTPSGSGTTTAGSSSSQSAQADARNMTCSKDLSQNIQTIYFHNVVQPNDGNEIQNAIRSILPPEIKMVYAANQNALVVCTPPDLMAVVQKIVHDLDRSKTTYRLAYTFTQMDGGKRIGTPQHLALIVVPGQRTTLHLGSKVPVAAETPTPGVQTQFTYVDVGTSIEATVDELQSGARLKSKVDQTSAAADESIPGNAPHQPVIRQTTLEGMCVLILGKSLVLGSLDIPGSAAHVEVEVVMEVVK